jgi:Cu/Ag efflux pump CusA
VETVVRATRNRSVPIVLTAALVALALAPMAIHAGAPGREIVGPMAIVLIGGLVTGTLAALVVLPALIVALWRPPVASRRGQRFDPPAATMEHA